MQRQSSKRNNLQRTGNSTIKPPELQSGTILHPSTWSVSMSNDYANQMRIENDMFVNVNVQGVNIKSQIQKHRLMSSNKNRIKKQTKQTNQQTGKSVNFIVQNQNSNGKFISLPGLDNNYNSFDPLFIQQRQADSRITQQRHRQMNIMASNAVQQSYGRKISKKFQDDKNSILKKGKKVILQQRIPASTQRQSENCPQFNFNKKPATDQRRSLIKSQGFVQFPGLMNSLSSADASIEDFLQTQRHTERDQDLVIQEHSTDSLPGSTQRRPIAVFHNYEAEKEKTDLLKDQLQLQRNYQYLNQSISLPEDSMNKADALRLQQAIIKTTTERGIRKPKNSYFQGSATPLTPPNAAKTAGPMSPPPLVVQTGNTIYQNNTIIINRPQEEPNFSKPGSQTIVINRQQENAQKSGTGRPSPHQNLQSKRRGKRISSHALTNSGSRNGEIYTQAQQQSSFNTQRQEQSPKKVSKKFLEVIPSNSQNRPNQTGPPPRTASGAPVHHLSIANTGQYLQLPVNYRSPSHNLGYIRLNTANNNQQQIQQNPMTMTMFQQNIQTTNAHIQQQQYQQQQNLSLQISAQQQKKAHSRVQSFPRTTNSSKQYIQQPPVYPGIVPPQPIMHLGAQQAAMYAQPGQTPVLVPAQHVMQHQGINAHQLPPNGYLLGYINSTSNAQGHCQQIMIPAVTQSNTVIPPVQNVQVASVAQTSRDIFRQKKKKSILLEKTKQPLDQNSTQSDSPQKGTRPPSAVDESEGGAGREGIQVRGNSVSMTAERSPTEMLKKVVRLRGQNEESKKKKSTQPARQKNAYSVTNNAQFKATNTNHNSSMYSQPVQPIFNHQMQVLSNQLTIPQALTSHMPTLSGNVIQQQFNAPDDPQYQHFAIPVAPQHQQFGAQGNPNSPKALVFLAVLQQQNQQYASSVMRESVLGEERDMTLKPVLKERSRVEVVDRRMGPELTEPVLQQKDQSLNTRRRSSQLGPPTKRKRKQQSATMDASPSETPMSPQDAAMTCLTTQNCLPMPQGTQAAANSSRQIQKARLNANLRPSSRSGTLSVQPRMRQKDPHPTSPHTAQSAMEKNKMSGSASQADGVVKESPTPPCMIVQMYQPPSAIKLAKEIARIDDIMAQLPQQRVARLGMNQTKERREPLNLTVNLKEHPINVCFRKANEFSAETFLKPGDNKMDLKKVQQLCNFFRIAMPHRVHVEPKKLKSREFQICAKERILIFLYETINKENGMIRPDAASWAQDNKAQPPFQGDQATSSYFGATHGGPKEREEREANQQFLVNPYVPNQRKFYIGRGNNHQIVRIVFKQRWWWQMTNRTLTASYNPASFENNHFLWTQWRKDHLLQGLPTFRKKCEQNKTDSRPKSLTPNKSENTLEEKSHGNQRTDRMCLYGKLEANYHLSNKKALFWNMTNYYQRCHRDPFESLPLTFHVEHGLSDHEFVNFKNYFHKVDAEIKLKKEKLQTAIKDARKAYKKAQKDKELKQQNHTSPLRKNYEVTSSYTKEAVTPKPVAETPAWYFEPYDPDTLTYLEDEEIQNHYKMKIPRNIWILKPGENSNQGCGINVSASMQEITQLVRSTQNAARTLIIQKYIDRPLLFAGRKFDIRIFAVIASINSQMKGYVYTDGYLRTSSKEFSLDNLGARFVHLTNDAIQQNSEEYGKFESGNKISFQQFQRYLDHQYPERKCNFNRDLLSQIKRQVTDSMYATFSKLDPSRRQHSFEIFGYDFMIDQNFKVSIIECNTNPSLELSCPLMARIIPAMLDNVFRVVVDPLFPPPDFSVAKKNLMHDILPINKLELIFDERISGEYLRRIFKDGVQMNLRIQDDEGQGEEEEQAESEESHDEQEAEENANGGQQETNNQSLSCESEKSQ